jgi:hypothetical protein
MYSKDYFLDKFKKKTQTLVAIKNYLLVGKKCATNFYICVQKF